MIHEIYDDEGRRNMRGIFCTDDRRASAAAMTAERWVGRGFGNPEVRDDPEEVARELKGFKAQDFASIWNDSGVGTAVVNGMMDFLGRNEVDDLWEAMTWEQQGVVYAALAYGYAMGEGRLPDVAYRGGYWVDRRTGEAVGEAD